jgi:hypothetical protein
MENEVEKIKKLIDANLQEIGENVLCFSESEAFSHKVVIRIWLDKNKILIDRVSGDYPYVSRVC